MPWIKSLNLKLLLLVVCFIALSGLGAGWWQGQMEARRLEAAYDQRLQKLLVRYKRQIHEALQERGELLHGARDSLLLSLRRERSRSVPEDFSLPRDPDGAYRLFQGEYGLFVHRDTPINENVKNLVYASAKVWRHVEPLLKTHFDAFYFISRERVSLVWPGEIARNHLPDHDVTQEIFYSYANPENNPQREARWTPIYFDFYTQVWMLSLLVPVYEGEEFLGVVGADLGMDFLFQQLASLDSDIENLNAYIFADSGELILRDTNPFARDMAPANSGYELLGAESDSSTGMTEFIDSAVAGRYSEGEVYAYKLDGEPQRISHYRLPGMDWYLSLSYPANLIHEEHSRTSMVIYSTIAAQVLFLCLVLFFGVKVLVTDRVTRLSKATLAIDPDNWRSRVPQRGRDEISLLGRSINSLLEKISDLIRGLSSNIKQLEAANLESQKLISAVEHSSSLVVILDRDWQLEYANGQFWELSGYREGDRLTPAQALMLDEREQDAEFFDRIYAVFSHQQKTQSTTSETSNPEWRSEYLARKKDGEHFWLMQSISVVRSSDGELKNYVCVGQDISDLKLNQQKMETLAYYDQLTGLQNRLLFKDQLRAALSSAEREGHHLALLYLDLDHFKRINDTLGHEAGDRLLVEVAQRLKNCLREEDSIARLGGDEFAILLKQVESAQYSFVVAKKIIAELNRPLILLGQEVVVGVSIGITLAPDDSRDIDVLMKNADLAMYQAKYQGRNVFQFYTPEMNREVTDRMNLESELRQAVKNQEFELYYQPLVDLHSGKIIGAEALIRWRHPTKGLIDPGAFIPLAEESGLIVPIGKWVFRSACQQAKSIQKTFGRDVKISINVSARQINEQTFVQDFKSILEEVRLDPHALELEITESTLIADTDLVLNRLKALRDLGITLAIDDFGTGYSSLSVLKRLPLDILKVDRSFVEGLPEDEEDRAITSLIVAMANSLNYRVIVEGVETVEQLNFLRRCGCDYAQGFYFSRPMPADRLMQTLFDWDSDAFAEK